MAENVVKLEFDLMQTQAALEKSQAQLVKLREEVKKYKGEATAAGSAGSAAYQKTAAEVRKTATETEKAASKVRSLGGALNQIGGTGTGQIAQVAGALGMLASPIGVAVASLSLVSKAWEEIASAAERSAKITESELKRQAELSSSISETNTKKGQAAVSDVKLLQGSIQEYGTGGPGLIEEYSTAHRMKRSDTAEALSIVAPFASKWKKGNLDTLFNTIGQLSDFGMTPQEAAKELSSDFSAQMLSRTSSVKSAKRIIEGKRGKRFTDIEYLDLLKSVRSIPGASEVKEQNILRDTPTPSGYDAKIVTVTEKIASLERRFPGAGRVFQERQKLSEEYSAKKSKEEYYSDAFRNAYDNEIIPIMKTYYNIRNVGLTGVGGAYGEAQSAKEALETNISETKKTAPWITDESLKLMQEFVTEMKILNRNMTKNAAATSNLATVTASGMSE